MYQLTKHAGMIVRLSDGAHIPADPANAAYRAFLAWCDAGHSPAPYVEPPAPGPQVVSRFQARAALHLAGLLPQVEALMASPEADPLARLAWSDAQEFRRNSPTVAALAAALGLTAQQLDELFVTAAGIEA
ncbi:hypothetical protein [Caldimonas tepidiphila]|uniref:hypothetical protein n=1 Tax=Caldimonas tepidiphila TaxID=2315841 RepID=UPI000E5A15B0|nr:hypothetical protein [Caldimonas tepidiphila]